MAWESLFWNQRFQDVRTVQLTWIPVRQGCGYIADPAYAQTAWHSTALFMTCFIIESGEAMRYPFDSLGCDLA